VYVTRICPNINYPTRNSPPSCATASATTRLPHLALFISIYWCLLPLPSSPALLHTPALPSGTLGLSIIIPATLRTILVSLIHSAPQQNLFFWVVGNYRCGCILYVRVRPILIHDKGHYRCTQAERGSMTEQHDPHKISVEVLEFRRQYRAHRMTSSDARFGIVYHSSFTYHAGTFSLFSEPRIHSIILYICSTLTSQSPRVFARVPVPTRVNEGDTFILTRRH
jgi:hypothetical protein